MDGMMELWLPENPDHVSASCRQSERMSGDSFMAVCKNLRSIMDTLGHTKINVLKMDIEGAEYEVIQAMVADSTIDKLDYLLIEFHHWMPSFKNEDTLHSIKTLASYGFDVLWVSDSGHELLFGR